MARALPPIFVSHGSPMTALVPGVAGRFMQQLGPALDATFGRPRAIIAVSAHSLTREPALLAAPRHEAVYDFGGFDPRLNTLRYDAPGDPALARDAHDALRRAGITAHVVPQGGLDHGIWTPLRYLYPDADIPTVPLAWVPTRSPRDQWALGAALAPLLADGVLLMASGSITHNLSGFMRDRPAIDTDEVPQSTVFRSWFSQRAAARDWEALFDYRRAAPHAVAMHPSDEHLLPWFVAAGAAGGEHPALRVHDSAAYAWIGMDAYAFGAESAELVRALAGRDAVMA
jgi:4,5-DOPA dioxygenase extradiol